VKVSCFLFNKKGKNMARHSDRKNVREELLRHVQPENIKCAYIHYMYGFDWDEDTEPSQYVLKVEHNNEELELFLNSLEFNYNPGFGSQELDGVIWLKDGTWLDRREYDGSEWWQLNKMPEIPNELR